jgi:hypothetical protein
MIPTAEARGKDHLASSDALGRRSLIHASIIARISLLTGRGQQSDSYKVRVKGARAFSFAHSLASTWALLESF